MREPGITRLDVAQLADNSTRLVPIGAYCDAAAPIAHKVTYHYATWRDTVAPITATPHSIVERAIVFPADAEWRWASDSPAPAIRSTSLQ
ncbi:MAG: antibiotic biosynthesis monooxygenase [Opitutaceae bacterium]|nr:antibiotic biosynthesis monooxygenase [Opitutaceae bacterium]